MKTMRVADEPLLTNLLLSVLHFMARSGMTKEQLQRAFSQSLRELGGSDSGKAWLRHAAPRLGDETVESGVLRLWHRSPRYLNDEAHPLAIPLYGRAPSVESLVRMQRTGSDPKNVIQGLKKVGLIRRISSGRYVPVQDAAMIGEMHSLSVGHAGKAIMRLLGTVLHNTSGKKVRLIERTARVPDLDAREAKAFADFTRRQGLAYLQSVDDWLETRRLSGKPKTRAQRSATTGAGVHLFAYIGDEVDDDLSPRIEGSDEESFQRSTWAVPSGNRRALATCTTSGVPA
jgi:hypothetical protein